MASLMQTINQSAAQVVLSVGAIGGVVSKNMAALDRVSDASYSHADTFVKNTELRNQGSIADTILDEEERDHERRVRRSKFEDTKAQFTSTAPAKKPARKSKS